jgi:hypothetical protein
MSRFKNVVPVPLGEIREIDGKIAAQMVPGTLVTAVSNFAGGSTTHAQPIGVATLTANAANNVKGVLILQNQEDQTLVATSTAFASGSHCRAHVLKAGEEVTVILEAAEAVVAGAILSPVANGKVKVSNSYPMFSAIETASAESTGDQLRILARVL